MAVVMMPKVNPLLLFCRRFVQQRFADRVDEWSGRIVAYSHSDTLSGSEIIESAV